MLENAIQKHFSQRVILTPRNNDVDLINNALLQTLPDDSNTYASVGAFNDSGIVNDAISNQYPEHPVFRQKLLLQISAEDTFKQHIMHSECVKKRYIFNCKRHFIIVLKTLSLF